MSYMMLHGLGDCTPEQHCGCLADAAATGEYREVWDASVPPGGFICSICQMPVESEPCPEHAPGSRPVSASPAVVAAVQQAMTEHLADFDIEVAAQRCRCGLVVGDSTEAEAHRVEMVAAAAEAAALEAAAEAVRERVPYGAELLPDGREDPAMAAVVEAHHEVWAWLEKRAREVRGDG